MGFAAHGLEHLGRRAAVGPGLRQPELDLLLQPGDADLEVFVQVGRDDGDEAQPLEQRHRVVRRLREHAAVEREETELAVQELGRDGKSSIHRRTESKPFYRPHKSQT
jgi:hypothetical protein